MSSGRSACRGGRRMRSGLRRLALERDRRREVDEQLHPQDLERQELALGDEDRRDEDEAEERDVGRERGRRGPSGRCRRSAGPRRGRTSASRTSRRRATRSDASRATAVPLPIATATSAPWRAGRVVHAVAGHRHDPPGRSGRPGRAAASGPAWTGRRRGALGSSRASRASSQAASSSPVDDPVRVEARLARRSPPPSAGGRRSRRRPGCRRHAAVAIASRMPGRIGSAKPTSARICHGPSSMPASQRDEPLAGRGGRLDQVGPALRRASASPAHRHATYARTTSGAPSASSSTRGRRGAARVRGHRARRRRRASASTRSPRSRVVVAARSATAARSAG